jgi:hypothetical protein
MDVASVVLEGFCIVLTWEVQSPVTPSTWIIAGSIVHPWFCLGSLRASAVMLEPEPSRLRPSFLTIQNQRSLFYAQPQRGIDKCPHGLFTMACFQPLFVLWGTGEPPIWVWGGPFAWGQPSCSWFTSSDSPSLHRDGQTVDPSQETSFYLTLTIAPERFWLIFYGSRGSNT